ncbi:MAG: monovalent cation/H(+) antiporter subunit G [Oscillospiraceae bacterium]|jgi:multicomponent Na+:H+ antiporter subunit G|nr:monovalent cation/H(+) antiporter subunit G [Oscillospiraceae bacterium]
MILQIVCDVLFLISVVFALAGTLGIIKMPDTFSRMQASTCVSTLGVLGVIIGGILYAAIVMHSASTAIKIGVIGLMILVTNPIGSHVLARGAYKSGIRPEKPMETDDLGRDFDE